MYSIPGSGACHTVGLGQSYSTSPVFKMGIRGVQRLPSVSAGFISADSTHGGFPVAKLRSAVG